MRESNVRPAIAAACFLLIPIFYVGSYFALLVPTWNFSPNTGNGVVELERDANYRFGGTVARVFFLPIHAIDRRMRPGFWSSRSFH